MKFIPTPIPDLCIVQPNVFGDERGFFLETFHVSRYSDLASISVPFIQDNHSRSSRDVLRGLHFQKTKPQGKLVRVVRGEVFDVAVDLRKESNTFGKWEAVILSEENKKQLWVPEGFAHGFLVLSEIADFEYKCSEFYNPKSEKTLMWNDATLNIPWPSKDPELSEKDAKGLSLLEYSS